MEGWLLWELLLEELKEEPLHQFPVQELEELLLWELLLEELQELLCQLPLPHWNW